MAVALALSQLLVLSTVGSSFFGFQFPAIFTPLTDFSHSSLWLMENRGCFGSQLVNGLHVLWLILIIFWVGGTLFGKAESSQGMMEANDHSACFGIILCFFLDQGFQWRLLTRQNRSAPACLGT